MSPARRHSRHPSADPRSRSWWPPRSRSRHPRHRPLIPGRSLTVGLVACWRTPARRRRSDAASEQRAASPGPGRVARARRARSRVGRRRGRDASHGALGAPRTRRLPADDERARLRRLGAASATDAAVDAPQLLELLSTCDLTRFAMARLDVDFAPRLDAGRARLDRAALRRCRNRPSPTAPTQGIPMIHFQHPAVLLLLVPLVAVAWWLGRSGRPSAVAHSSTDLVRAVARPASHAVGPLPPASALAERRAVRRGARAPQRRAPTSARSTPRASTSCWAIDVSGSMQARDMLGPRRAR